MKKLVRMLFMPPDCRDVAEVLQSYLDGELPASRRHLVAKHLEHCQRCGIEADLYREVKRSLEQLAVPPDRRAVQRLRRFARDLAEGEAS